MDEQFRFFYETNGFGPAELIEPCPPALIERLAGKLPEQMLSYWREYGFARYGRGLFWTVNPEEYAPVLEAWLKDMRLPIRDQFYVLGRSAFGKLLVWGTGSGQSLTIVAPSGLIAPRDQTAKIAEGKGDFLAKRFFGGRDKKSLDQPDASGELLFDRAVEELGVLETGEMYGFEPALGFGGEPKLRNLQRVDAVTHLMLLAQLTERIVMRDTVQDARNAGLVK